jgi:glutaredoxin-related protein
VALGDPQLESVAASERVVVFHSGLTDVSRVRRALESRHIAHRFESMAMGDESMRQRFRHLKDGTGWSTLPIVFVDGEFIGGENELMGHRIIAEGPPGAATSPARWMGYAGLVPFALPVAGILAGANDAWFLDWLTGYGAVILSFVGALQWGLALDERRERRGERILVSVVPALAGWLALLMPHGAGIALLIGGFLGIYSYERFTLWPGGYPVWFRRLRTQLTAGACLLLGAGLLAAFLTG